MNYFYKKESIVIFGSILIILLVYLIYLIFKKISNINYNVNGYEYFRSNSDSNSKRNKMMKIYKNNDILDPDENTNLNTNDDNNDPDSSKPYDPDNYSYKIYDPYSSNTSSRYNAKLYDPYSSIGYGYNPYR